ncbi:MAG: tripartite tricarboxylate transporter substrate binding protein, partial [Streptomycetales bacterium]
VRPGVNVTVENRPSGNGAVGYSYVFAREGDGHYLVPSETSGVALPMTTETPWEWRDFTPVTQVAEDATLMVVPADSRYQNLQDVIEAGKQGTQPRMGVAGATGLDSIVTGLMERDQGIEFRRVTFDSGGEIVAALLGGDIDTAMLNPSEVIGQLEAGKMRAVAAFAEDRYDRPPLDDIPTAKEQGVDVSFTQYRGAFAPGGLPEDQLAYWEETIGKWMKTASYREFIESNFLRPVRRPHDEFVSYLEDYEKQLETVLER